MKYLRPPKMQYMPNTVIGPVFYADDPDAQVLGMFHAHCAPDRPEQLPVRDDAVRVPRHVHEQIEFLRREPHLGRAHVDAPAIEIDAEIAGIE